MKTLVIILSETRAHELTYKNFEENVIHKLNADLCLCIGTKDDYDISNPFYQNAKYRFTYPEPDDYGDAFDKAYKEIISQNDNSYFLYSDINSIYGKIKNPTTKSEDIHFLGSFQDVQEIHQYIQDKNLNYEDIVYHDENFPSNEWRYTAFGITKRESFNFVKQKHVHTFTKRKYGFIPWRYYLQFKDQFLGGIKDLHHQHPGSAGILIFFRWFLHKKLKESGLINEYDRFIISRSDFIYRLPHPSLYLMNPQYIWIPDCEHYQGYTDRHVVLSKENIHYYLNIFENMVVHSHDFYFQMKSLNKSNWNLEQFIKFNFKYNQVLNKVKEFPYIMFTVRNIDGTSRWSHGTFNNDLNCFVKYQSEFHKSNEYLTLYQESNIHDIDLFYKNFIHT